MSEETQSLDDETTTEKLQEVIKKLDMSPKNVGFQFQEETKLNS